MSDRVKSLPGLGLRKTCGCAAARWQKCPHPWQWSGTIAGRQIRKSLKTEDYDEAMKLRAELLASKGKGKPAPMTFAQVSEKYVAEETRAEGKDNRRYHAALAAGLLDGRPIDDFEPEDIDDLQARYVARDRGEKKAFKGPKDGRQGAKRMLATVRRIFNWAIKKRLATRTPFRRHGVAMLAIKAEEGRSRRLEGDEEKRLLAAATRPLTNDLIVAALETGARAGELLSLQWAQVRRGPDGVIKSIELVASKTKTRRARTIPVTLRLRKILARRQRGPDGETLGPGCYVFGSETGERRESFRESWLVTCEGAKIPKDEAGRFTLHFHDLRREFASRLLESGATLAEVQSALGHTSITMTSRYLGVTDAGLQKSFERFEKHRKAPAAVLAFKRSKV